VKVQVCQHEFANLSLPLEGRLRRTQFLTQHIKAGVYLKYALFCIVGTTLIFIKTLTNYISLKAKLLQITKIFQCCVNYCSLTGLSKCHMLHMSTMHLRKDFYVQFKAKNVFLLVF